jgi:hypothetical protein
MPDPIETIPEKPIAPDITNDDDWPDGMTLRAFREAQAQYQKDFAKWKTKRDKIVAKQLHHDPLPLTGTRPMSRTERILDQGVPTGARVLLVGDSTRPMFYCEHVPSPIPSICVTCMRQGRITDMTAKMMLLAVAGSEYIEAHPEEREDMMLAIELAIQFADDYIERNVERRQQAAIKQSERNAAEMRRRAGGIPAFLLRP